MPKLSVTCQRCRNRIEVDASFLGQTLYCPSCNSAIKIEPEASPAPPTPASEPTAPSPSPAEPAAPTPSTQAPDSAAPGKAPHAAPAAEAPRPSPPPDKPRIRLLHDRSGSGTARICPQCREPLSETDIVCPACGWNTKSQRSMADVVRRLDAARDLVAMLTRLLIAIGVGWLLWKAGLPKWYGQVRAFFTEEETAPAANVAAPAPPSEDEIAEVRRQVTEQLNAAHPFVDENEEVALELRSNRTLRGRFNRGEGDAFAVAPQFGPPELHTYPELDEISRLRCDREYRERRIEEEVKRKLGL